MIIYEVHIESVTVLKSKDQAPVSSYGDAPEPVQIAAQSMKPPTRISLHLVNIGRRIQGG
jgi:hypothetical protein